MYNFQDELNHVLVTGIMRSGTTYSGNVISQHKNYSYIHEPFSYQTGIQGVKHWFPYCNSLDSYYAQLLNDFLNLKYKYKYFPPSDRGVLAAKIKRKIGGKADWLGWKYKYFARIYSQMLIKDPLSSLLSHWYIKQHEVKVICMIRHPLAFYYSNKRLGWDFDLNNLRKQTELVEDYLSAEVDLLNKDLVYPERLALLWRCIYKYFLRISQEFDSTQLLMVRHEDLCEKPLDTFNEIFDFINLDINSKIESFIDKTTSSKNRIEANEKAHLLERDTNHLKGYWKGKIDKEEKELVLKYVEGVMDEYY